MEEFLDVFHQVFRIAIISMPLLMTSVGLSFVAINLFGVSFKGFMSCVFGIMLCISVAIYLIFLEDLSACIDYAFGN